MDELIAFLDGRKYLRSVSDAAIGRACGGGEIVHTGGDYWRVKEQPGVAGDEEEAEPPSDERPYGRTHFTCSVLRDRAAEGARLYDVPDVPLHGAPAGRAEGPRRARGGRGTLRHGGVRPGGEGFK